METVERERALDVIKGVGILLVVVGHTNCPNVLKTWIYSFHMPLFFMVAGYLFNERKWKELGLLALMRDRFKKYIIPFISFFIINFVVKVILDYIKRGDAPILQYLFAGLWSHDTLMPNCAPLWFLTCLFVSYNYFWIILGAKTNIIRLLVCAFYLVLLVILCRFNYWLGINQLPWHVETGLAASLFMFAGFFLRRWMPKIDYKLSITMFLAGTIICFLNHGRINMVENRYHDLMIFFLSAVLISLSLFCIIKRLRSDRYLRLFVYLGGVKIQSLFLDSITCLIHCLLMVLSGTCLRKVLISG